MPVQFDQCSKCGTVLLPDTPECPSCHHVAESSSDQAAAIIADRGEEQECSSCGESVRVGLVRCWNCGSFMRDDIAEAYQKLRSVPPQVIYSQLPEGETIDDEELRSAADGGDDDADFHLGDDESFELAADVAPAEPGTIPIQQPPRQQPAAPQAKEDSAGDGGEVPPPQTEVPAEASAGGAGDHPDVTSVNPAEAPPPLSPDQAGDDEPPPQRSSEGGKDDVAHSVATGGDVLLEVALQEEKEIEKMRGRRPSRMRREGLLVYCPHGHRILVQEKHRGRTGKCPVCKSPFSVPMASWSEQKPAGVEGDAPPVQGDGDAPPVQEESDELSAGNFTRWMLDVSVHTVDPLKLKIKEGSLEKDFAEADMGFSPEEAIVMSLARKSGGLFGGGGGKKEENRDAMLSHLAAGKSVDKVPGGDAVVYEAEKVTKIAVVQPVAEDQESMFAGIPVFGKGRIAVRLPRPTPRPKVEAKLPEKDKKGKEKKPPKEKKEKEPTNDLQFVSFTLTDFRRFSKIMGELYGEEDYGSSSGVPLWDYLEEYECHYTRDKVLGLLNLEFYEVDPAFELKLTGRQCEACGIAVSEDARKKEKLGGANGRGIAKAKCPACGEKFGSISLHTIENPKVPEGGVGAEVESEESTGAGESPSGEESTAAAEAPEETKAAE